MEQRKVVSLGRSSLVVSLPRDWVKSNDLKRGDVVSLAVQRDRSLVVFPGVRRGRGDQKITLRIDPNEEEASIARKIIACYLNGYFGIELVSTGTFTPAQQKVIRDVVGKLYMRIMESDAKNVRLQTLIDESKASVEAGIQRMHSIAISMCRDVLNSLRNRDIALAKVISPLDEDVDHFSFFLLRLLRSAALDPALADRIGLKPIDCLDYQTLVHRIEQIADHAANIAEHIIFLNGRKQKVSDQILELMFMTGKEVLDAYDRAVKAFFSGDVEEANKIMELLRGIKRLDEEIAYQSFVAKQKNPVIICSTCSMRDSRNRIAECVADLAKITINRSYETTPQG